MCRARGSDPHDVSTLRTFTSLDWLYLQPGASTVGVNRHPSVEFDRFVLITKTATPGSTPSEGT